MQKVATKLQSFETREEKRKVEVRQKLNEAKVVAESSLGAALVGFLHGRFEDADANFFIPRTSIPADFAMGLTGVGLAFFDMFG
jgi:predicted lipid carrier protein YhbT